jgi:pimeloyl-ACP methyl ester carboxylesterase
VREDDEDHLWVDEVWLRCSLRNGPGRPLLLVNGLGGNLEMWEPFRRKLTDRPTIAYDAPGTGGSSTPLRPRSIRQLADLARHLLDHFRVGEVDVLGYSFGGTVAQELARAEPERVRRLVLAATTCGWGAPLPNPLAVGALMSPARYYFGDLGHEITRLAFGDPDDIELRWCNAARERRPPSVIGYLWQTLAVASWSSHAWLPELDQPTLVLAGEHDRAVPIATAKLLVGRIRRSRLVVLAGAGHSFLLANDARTAAQVVSRFLSEATPDRQPPAFVAT